VTTPTGHQPSHAAAGQHSRSNSNSGFSNSFPGTITAIEEKVAYMTDVVDRAASVTPTERRSVSRTNSYSSSRSSRNSSIVSEKAVVLGRNNSVSANTSSTAKETVAENSSQETNTISATTGDVSSKKSASTTSTTSTSSSSTDKWSELERKYSKNSAQQLQLQQSAESIGDKISRLKSKSASEEAGGSSAGAGCSAKTGSGGGGISSNNSERPKDLALAKKLSSGALISSPGTLKNFKELAEKWQTIAVETTPTTPVVGGSGFSAATLPRKSSKEKSPSPVVTPTARETSAATMPRRSRYGI
jgi:hypothetical protein